uniref:Uncharacterized protein n=1 Tax=Arundo donax TaxID=35708 RepID=A0A0A8YYM1_ARUDO
MEIEATSQDKCFLWYLGTGAILTKDNLAKRN